MKRWLLRYDDYDPAAEGVRESLCTLGNGYFATRGAAPESTADGVHYPGTYVTGVYDRLTTKISGHDVENEDIVNVPNWLPLTFRLNGGPWFSADAATLVSFRQELDMRRGVLTRLLRLRDDAGRTTSVTQRRLVSMEDPHLAAIETTILPEDWSGRVEVRSALDGTVANAGVARYRALNGAHLEPVAEGEAGDEVSWLRVRTVSSRIEIAVAARTRVHGAVATREVGRKPGWICHDLIMDVTEGTPVTVDKVVALFTSRDRAIAECASAAWTRASRAAGFDALLERHTLAWERIWRRCRISIDHEDAQRVLNLHMFHLLQTVSEHTVDLDAGVPARGLHGEAYRGHVFWDELFVLPFLILRFPEIARSLLRYRWRRLPEARWAAHEAGLPGAMYPWQSGSDGREETQRLHLNPNSGRWLPDNSHLQRHVGLAIAYNVWRFYEATGDTEFMAEYGAEMLLEIARFFAGLATYDRTLDRYEIRGVMGPDEYHDGYPWREAPGIDNNAYTNIMTVWVLRRALTTLADLPEYRRSELMERLALQPEEISRFEDLTRKMRVDFHDGGIISQFEGYEELAELDWPAYRERYGDIRRLDRILEAEGDSTNAYRASKQADVLMLFYLLQAEELSDILAGLGYVYDAGLIPRTIAYYMDRTSHGSTLSALVHAWVLARSDGEEAWRYFLETLNADIDDLQHGTTAEGVHLGAMAGTVDLVQRCYAGVETMDGVLRLNPRLPGKVELLRFELRYRGHWGIDVSCGRDRMRVRLRPDGAASIKIAVPRHDMVTLQPGDAWEIPLTDGRVDLEPDLQRAGRPLPYVADISTPHG
ncbi:MAG TPA: glycosyl hydrolase family 65 protein [Streptosporangiaceae bacterium]|nr:glycosyl hydrolase family 65 protein [Streptosporangiaceae bacterium]